MTDDLNVKNSAVTPLSTEELFAALQDGEPFSSELMIAVNRIVRGLSQAMHVEGMPEMDSPKSQEALIFQTTFGKAMQIAREERLAADAQAARAQLTDLLQEKNAELKSDNAALLKGNQALTVEIEELRAQLATVTQECEQLRKAFGEARERGAGVPPISPTSSTTPTHFLNPLGSHAR